MRIKKRKSSADLVPRNATTGRQFNVVKRTCKGIEFCKGAFGEKKVKYVSEKNAGALIKKKQYVFKRIVHSTESVLTAPHGVLSEKLDILF